MDPKAKSWEEMDKAERERLVASGVAAAMEKAGKGLRRQPDLDSLRHANHAWSGGTKPFGRSLSTPIPVVGTLGEILYLSYLVTLRGQRVLFHRRGSGFGRANMVDIYELVSLDGSSWDVLFLDPYADSQATEPPEGYAFARMASDSIEITGHSESVPRFPAGMHAAATRIADALGPVARVPFPSNIDALGFERPPEQLARLQSREPTPGTGSAPGASGLAAVAVTSAGATLPQASGRLRSMTTGAPAIDMKKLAVILSFLAIALIGFAYAFRWEYRARGTLQIRTNRWTGATECFPSYHLLWTEFSEGTWGGKSYGRAGQPCWREGEPGLSLGTNAGTECRSHRVAAWGPCGPSSGPR